MSKDGSVRITFKIGEEDLKEYINRKSSPAAYVKDLIREDIQKHSQSQVNSNNSMMHANMFDLID